MNSYPDLIDAACAEQERMNAQAIENIRNTTQGLKPRGDCYWCNEPMDVQKLFCDVDCANDHAHYHKNKIQE